MRSVAPRALMAPGNNVFALSPLERRFRERSQHPTSGPATSPRPSLARKVVRRNEFDQQLRLQCYLYDFITVPRSMWNIDCIIKGGVYDVQASFFRLGFGRGDNRFRPGDGAN